MTFIPALREAAITLAVGAMTFWIWEMSIPARSNIPPFVPKSFCMSITSSAVRSGSIVIGPGRASRSISHLKIATGLPGPEPAEGAGDQQTINEAIEGFLEDHTPRLALPNAVDHGTQTVSQKRGGSSDAKHSQILRAG